MTFQYTNYKVEVKNLKFTTDDGKVFPNTAIVTLLDSNNQTVSVELFGYLEIEKLSEMIDKKEFGKMVALRGTDIVGVALEKAVGKLKTVPKERYDEAKLFFEDE